MSPVATDSQPPRDAPDEAFVRPYANPPGLYGVLAAVNNQSLGIRFMVTSFVFFFLGGILALLMRIQLIVPENTFLSAQRYNEIFTMHGSTMMYLFAVPFLEGLAVYLLPTMIGARDLAFPRLTSFSYWIYVFGGTIFYSSFLVGSVPDAGWFAYTPLSGPKYSGIGVDFWLLGLSLVEIAGITAGAELVVTILKFRAPGMSINRMPLYVWAMLTVGVMILFAFTTLLCGTFLLELDRAVGTRFFDTTRGGSALLWQHLFWFFGHPEVYIVFIPATGIVSMVVLAFARRIVAYALIVVAIILTGFVSFGLWVHHMYATGLPELSLSFFAAASLMIGVASGTQVFAWIASLWGTRPALKTPLMYILGFLFIFVLGGLTGVMIAIVPFDWQVHDTYFIVAHFHYVLIGGAIFPIFAGLYFWLPKITGRMMGERLGQLGFWLTFIGFNVTFFPMHLMGFWGMPRRVYTYPKELEIAGINVLSTAGAFVLSLGFVVFVIDFFRSRRTGTPAGDNPWNAATLEWSVSSPPPVYGFYEPPLVNGREPLWVKVDPADESPSVRQARAALRGNPVGWRATLCTDEITAAPESVQWLPTASIVPFFAAVALTAAAAGVLMKTYIFSLGAAVVFIGLLVKWLWPNRAVLARLDADDIERRSGLPLWANGTRAAGWWGMVCLIVVLGMAVATLLFSYFYLQLYSKAWPQDGLPLPGWKLPMAALATMLITSAAQFAGHRFYQAGNARMAYTAFGSCTLLGTLFFITHFAVLWREPFGPTVNAYASAFHVICWMVALLVATGVVMNVALLVGLIRSSFRVGGFPELQAQIAGIYWHFVVGVTVACYLVLFVSPRVF